MIPDIIGLAPQHQGLMVRFGSSNHQSQAHVPDRKRRQKAEWSCCLLPAAHCLLPTACLTCQQEEKRR